MTDKGFGTSSKPLEAMAKSFEMTAKGFGMKG